jgi:hypothetical protein
VGASEQRDRLLARQRTLRARHDELAGAEGSAGPDAEALHRTGRLDPVLHDTDELIKVLDDIAVDTARRLRPAIFVLLGIAVVPAVLVASSVLPAVALLGSLLLLVVAVALWLIARTLTGTGS